MTFPKVILTFIKFLVMQLYSHFLKILSKRGFNVQSFGTGNQVKLPGPALDKPNIYDFGTTYDAMYRDLMQKDYELYP